MLGRQTSGDCRKTPVTDPETSGESPGVFHALLFRTLHTRGPEKDRDTRGGVQTFSEITIKVVLFNSQ